MTGVFLRRFPGRGLLPPSSLIHQTGAVDLKAERRKELNDWIRLGERQERICRSGTRQVSRLPSSALVLFNNRLELHFGIDFRQRKVALDLRQ